MWTARVGMATPSSGHGTLVSVGHFWMFKVLRAFAFVLSLLGTCVLAWGELPRELRVVTYNIHHGEGMDKKFGLERIAKLLMADILLAGIHIPAFQVTKPKATRILPYPLLMTGF